MKQQFKLWQSVALALFLILSVSDGYGASLTAQVKNHRGEPVKDAVVFLLLEKSTEASSAKNVMVDQVDKEFIPYVTAVQVGTRINFPNNDRIRHQVYSFSKAKNFEIPLYKGTPSDPVLFDRTGVVALGCNIHDWMSAYVFVSGSANFSVTDKQGVTQINSLVAGEHRIAVWHPQLKGKAGGTSQQITLESSGSSHLDFVIQQKRLFRAWRAPSNNRSGGYR